MALYTAVHTYVRSRVLDRMRSCPQRVHDRVYDPVHGLYTVVYRPCIWPVHAVYTVCIGVHGLQTRPCIRTRTCARPFTSGAHGRADGHVHVYTAMFTGRVHGLTQPCTGLVRLCTAGTRPCIRPFTSGAHGRVHTTTAVFTARVHGLYTAVYRPCTRPVQAV